MNEKSGIYLRPITVEDTNDIVKWRNSEAVRKYFIYQEDFTEEGHMNWLETKVNTGEAVQFMIVERGTDRAIGSVFLRDIDRKNKKAEYGIFIGDDSKMGLGIGTQTARLMIEYAFGQEKLHRLYLRVFADNDRAISSYKKAGFVVEGLLKDDVFVRNQYRDIVWMAVTNPKECGREVE